jgi:hypothetical protein
MAAVAQNGDALHYASITGPSACRHQVSNGVLASRKNAILYMHEPTKKITLTVRRSYCTLHIMSKDVNFGKYW